MKAPLQFVPIFGLYCCVIFGGSIALPTVLAEEMPIYADADDSSITISPYKLIVNAQGQYEDVLVIVRKTLPSGYNITDFDLTLFFDGVNVAQAYALRYCYVDDNFLASFDRTALQDNPDVLAMAGSEVVGRIEGTYTAENTSGETMQDTLSGQDIVEIMDPDWEMSITKELVAPAGDDVLVGFDTDLQFSQNLLPWDRGQQAETSCGQTFKFSRPFRLDKITMKVKTDTIDISGKSVELMLGMGHNHPTDSRLSSIILSPSEKLPNSMGFNRVWYLTFDFEDLLLLPNTDYAFMLRFASGGGKEGLEANVFAMGRYAYEDGAAFIVFGWSAQTILNNELVFFLHGEILSQSPLLGDANIDYRVDFEDYAAIADSWLRDDIPACCGADISCDGQIDFRDLNYLVLHWLDKL